MYFSNFWGIPILLSGQCQVNYQMPYQCMAADIPGIPFNTQTSCIPSIIQYPSRIVSNHVHFLNGKFTMLRIYMFSLGTLINNEIVQTASFLPEDIHIAQKVAAVFALNGQWDITPGNFFQYNPCFGEIYNINISMPEQNSYLYNVYDYNGVHRYFLQLFYFNDNSYSVLPVSYFSLPGYYQKLKLFLPPQPPYIWIGSQNLSKFPQADVILTHDVILAINNIPDSNCIFLANPGGIDWADKIEIFHLRGRKVICDFPTNDIRACTAVLQLVGRLNSYNIYPKFIIRNPQENRLFPYNDCISQNDFIKRIEKMGFHVPETICLESLGYLDLEGHNSKAIIENLIVPGTVTVIHEDKKVEPNILSGRLFISLKTGTAPFSNHCRNIKNSPIKCVLFIDMERKNKYSNILKNNSFHSDISDSSAIFDIEPFRRDVEEGKKCFNKILKLISPKVVIFDAESIYPIQKHMCLLHEIIRICIENDLAVVVIIRDKRILKSLSHYDKYIRIWKKGSNSNSDNKKHTYIMEFVTNNDTLNIIEPFEFHRDDNIWNTWISQDFPVDKLPELAGWSPENYDDSGVDESFIESLYQFSASGNTTALNLSIYQ